MTTPLVFPLFRSVHVVYFSRDPIFHFSYTPKLQTLLPLSPTTRFSPPAFPFRRAPVCTASPLYLSCGSAPVHFSFCSSFQPSRWTLLYGKFLTNNKTEAALFGDCAFAFEYRVYVSYFRDVLTASNRGCGARAWTTRKQMAARAGQEQKSTLNTGTRSCLSLFSSMYNTCMRKCFDLSDEKRLNVLA